MGTPPIFLAGTPRNTTGHGQGKREIHHAPIIEGVLSFAAKHKRRGLKNHTNGVTLPPFSEECEIQQCRKTQQGEDLKDNPTYPYYQSHRIETWN